MAQPPSPPERRSSCPAAFTTPSSRAFFLLFALSSLGLPGLNNFVGEVLILIGTFQAQPMIAIVGFCGIVFGVIYILRLVQDSLFGEPRSEHELWDLDGREVLMLAALALAVLFIGLHPTPVLNLLEQPVRAMLQQTQQVALIGPSLQ